MADVSHRFDGAPIGAAAARLIPCGRGCGAALRVGRPPADAAGLMCLVGDFSVDFPQGPRCPLAPGYSVEAPPVAMIGSDGRAPPALSGWPLPEEWAAVLREFSRPPPPRDEAAFASSDPPSPAQLSYLLGTCASTSNRLFPKRALDFFPQRIPMEVLRLLNPLLSDPSFDRHRVFPSPPGFPLPAMAETLRTWQKVLDATVCAFMRRIGEPVLFAFFSGFGRDASLGAKDTTGFPVPDGQRTVVVTPPEAYARAALASFGRAQAAGVDQGETLSLSLLDVLSHPPRFPDGKGLPVDPRPLLITFGFLSELAAAAVNRLVSATAYRLLSTAQAFLFATAQDALRNWCAAHGRRVAIGRRSAADDRVAPPNRGEPRRPPREGPNDGG